MGSPPRPPDTHTDCTQTHTDCTKHTHGLHTNTHILLPIVVFAIKALTKTHTYLERKSFFLDGGSRNNKYVRLLGGTPGAPDTVKYDTFGTPGALSQKSHTHTHTFAPGAF